LLPYITHISHKPFWWNKRYHHNTEKLLSANMVSSHTKMEAYQKRQQEKPS